MARLPSSPLSAPVLALLAFAGCGSNAIVISSTSTDGGGNPPDGGGNTSDLDSSDVSTTRDASTARDASTTGDASTIPDAAAGGDAATGCAPACPGSQVCVGNQTQGGGQPFPDDAGNCPPGLVHAGDRCAAPPTFSCTPFADSCLVFDCACAAPLCPSPSACVSTSPGQVNCVFFAP